MFFKRLSILACAAGCLVAASCTDSLNQVGNSILPETDKITAFIDTFKVEASTVKYDSLYARTNSGFVGEFYDPYYGRLKADFIGQFYCEDEFTFGDTPHEGKIDSVALYIMYSDWDGNPYVPMQMTIYPVVKELDKNFYSNVDPTQYCDMQNPVASLGYSPQSGALDTTYGYNIWTQKIPLPLEFGQKFYDETVNNPASFKDQEAFNRFFPGLYVTTDYGSGNMIYVIGTQIVINYHIVLQDIEGVDSIAGRYEEFNIRKDVIQLNRLESSHDEHLLEPNDEYTFQKTPAGIFTKLVIPNKQIREIVQGRILNYVSFNLKYMPVEEYQYAMTLPPYLLLIHEDSLTTFFENRSLENSVTSYVSTVSTSSTGAYIGYDESTRTYQFPNMVNMLNYYLINYPDEDLRLLAIPVSRTIATDSYSGTTYSTAISHYLAPSGLKLRKNEHFTDMVIVSSYLNR